MLKKTHTGKAKNSAPLPPQQQRNLRAYVENEVMHRILCISDLAWSL